MKEIVLEIKDLNKKFGDKKAVNNIDLTINEGEIYGLIGPNGAGKTTTIKMVTGLLLPDKGKIKINNEEDVVESRKVMAYIPDEPFVYQYLTGREFLNYVGSIYGLEKRDINTKVSKLIIDLGIEEEIDDLFESYSRGTKQKLMIIAALMREPKLLIIDEPIVGLDVTSQKLVKKMFRDFADKGGSVLLCTHTLSVAEEIADKIGILKDGKIIKEISENFENLENKYLKIINE